MKQNYQENL